MPTLTADLITTPRPSAEKRQQSAEHLDIQPVYIWSYLLTRSVVGFIGMALPVVLILGDVFVLSGSPRARGSLSAYYHSGMRDFFVGTLCVTGVFLLAYKVFSRTIENTLSSLAGVAALGVAVFPTGLPASREAELTPLQVRLGESVVTFIHFSCAFVFIALLAVICCFFAKRESKRDAIEGRRSAMFPSTFWGPFHYVCAAVIGLAVLFMVTTKWTGAAEEYALLIGESVAIFAFGVSWLAKGTELQALWPSGPRSRRPAEKFVGGLTPSASHPD